MSETSRVTNAMEVGKIKYSCGFLSRGHADDYVAEAGMKVWNISYQDYVERAEEDAILQERSDIYIGWHGGPVFTFDWQDFEHNYQAGCIELYEGTELKNLFKDIVPRTFQVVVQGPRNPEELRIEDFFELSESRKQTVFEMVCYGVNSGNWDEAASIIIERIADYTLLRSFARDIRSKEHGQRLQHRAHELEKLSTNFWRKAGDRFDDSEGNNNDTSN
jgi:hypothetical protein